MAYGATAMLGGAFLISESVQPDNDIGGWGIIGGILILFGAAVAFAGTFPFWLRTKRFNLGKQVWKMEVRKIYRDKYGKIKEL